jgi:sugar/nucleoside kinase (ribokinase family)
VLVCVLGDVLLDVIVRLERPLAAGDDVRSVTELRAGGQGANVAAWATALGARGRVLAARADDESGRFVAAELGRRGVEWVGPAVTGRTGVVVSVVDPSGERSLASDRGSSGDLTEIEPGWLAGCDVLHVSGYALAVSPDAAARAAALAPRVSVDLSSWTLIEEVGTSEFRSHIAALEPDVTFAGRGEFDALDGDVPGTVVEKWTLPQVDADAVDSTGAGDAFAAGFLVGGVELGLEAATRCVGTVGALP